MRKTIGVLLGVALLGGCGKHEEPKPRINDDAQAVAMVERMNQAPVKPIQPQPLTPEDLARYGLAQSGCAFRPGDDPGAAPLFVGQADRGFLKVEGVLQPVVAKSGSAELPSGAHSTYVGLDGWIELLAQAGEDGKGADGTQTWPSRLVIHDAQQRVSFNAIGRVSCSGSAAAG